MRLYWQPKREEAGRCHYLEQINVVMATDAAAEWFQINADAAAMIGPIDLQYGMIYTHIFTKPIKFPVNTAIKVDTEAAQDIHVIIEGFTVQNG